MILYCTIFLVSLLFAFFADICQRQIAVNRIKLSRLLYQEASRLHMLRNFSVFLSAGFLIVLSGLRYDTGYDYLYSYVPSLDDNRRGVESHYDPFFNAIIRLFSKLDSNQWFFFSMALLTTVLFFVGFYLNNEYILLPVAYYIASFHYLRSFCFVAQYVAMAVAFVGFMLLLKNRALWATVMLILAVMIHMSAIILAPFFLCYYLRNKAILVLSIVAPIVSLIGQGVILLVFRTVTANTRFSLYFAPTTRDFFYVDKTLILINLILYVLFIYIYCRDLKRTIRSKRASMFLLAQSLTLSFSLLQTILPVGYRFVWYYMIFQLVSISFFTELISDTYLNITINAVMLTCFFVWMIYVPIGSGSSKILPYHPIFNTDISIY